MEPKESLRLKVMVAIMSGLCWVGMFYLGATLFGAEVPPTALIAAFAVSFTATLAVLTLFSMARDD